MTSHNKLFTIDPGTGNATVVGIADGITGLAIAPAAVPEPGSVALVLAGLGGIWAVRRRRR